jgi:hypothetical protein
VAVGLVAVRSRSRSWGKRLMQSRLVASATAPETTSADDDDNRPDGDDGVVWRTADQLDADDGRKAPRHRRRERRREK